MTSKSIDSDALVTAHLYGDSVELSTSIGGDPIMRRLDRDHMVNTKTGEVKKVQFLLSVSPHGFHDLLCLLRRYFPADPAQLRQQAVLLL